MGGCIWGGFPATGEKGACPYLDENWLALAACTFRSLREGIRGAAIQPQDFRHGGSAGRTAAKYLRLSGPPGRGHQLGSGIRSLVSTMAPDRSLGDTPNTLAFPSAA